MAASLYDSLTWRGLFHDAELAPLFTDTAEIRANLLVMGTLALVQSKAGLIPEVSAKAIQRAAMEVQVDPAALSGKTAQAGDPVLALIAAFQSEMQAPEHAKWVHFDSETNLTAATGLSLRLRQALKIITVRARTEAQIACPAFHADPHVRQAMADGLGLAQGGDQPPTQFQTEVAQQINAWASEHPSQSAVGRAIQHQMGHLWTAIETATAEDAPLIISMTLPQMALGLGRMLS